MSTRVGRVVVLSALGALVVAAPGGAATDEDLERAVVLAHRVFPFVCGDRDARVEVLTEDMGVSLPGRIPSSQGYATLGGEGGCWIVLSRDWYTWPAPWVCRVVVHEFGHLAGLDHVSSTRSIMFSNAIVSRYKRCRWE